MNIIIRSYDPRDAEEVKKCIKQLKQTEAGYDPDFLTDESAIEALFKGLTEEIGDKGAIFVAEVDGNVVGFASAHIENKNDELICKKVNCVYMGDLAVLEEYRGLGIGIKLMEEVEKFAKEKNIKYLKLTMCAKNQRLMRIYKKFGFDDYEATMLKKLE